MKKFGTIIAGILGAALIIFGIYYFASGSNAEFKSPLAGDGTVDLGSVGKVTNPITGEQILSAKAEWKDYRPLAVMVNNHVDARPQSGLIYADVVYEVVAEGGITRFLAFFLSDTPEKIGPVRSTREYYLVLVKELGDAMLMHIGWSPQALEAIENWPVRSLGRGNAPFWRDNPRNVATEHTAFIDGKVMREFGNDLGWTGSREFKIWEFKDDKVGYDGASLATDLSIDFWYEGDYTAIFKYNPENNTYLRSMGYDAEGNPAPHRDQETNDQIEVKNVIVQFATESDIADDDKGRLEYELIGSGTGLVFLDGKVIDVTWTKEERDERTLFYDLDGNEMQFNRGKFWISIVPDRNVEQVVYN